MCQMARGRGGVKTWVGLCVMVCVCVCDGGVCLSGALLNFAQRIQENGTQKHTASNSIRKLKGTVS
jgi:hypothetical protein